MSDFLHSLLKQIDYGRYKVMAVILAVITMVYFYGCEPTMDSISDPGKSVNYDQFQADVTNLTSDMNKRVVDYNKLGEQLQLDITAFNQKVDYTQGRYEEKYEFREKLITAVAGVGGTLATGGTINIPEAISTALTLLLTYGGVGAIADKRRANAKILELKNQISSTTTTTST